MTDSLDCMPNGILQPLRQPHERKTFATPTLRLINSRLQYYRRILNQPEPNTDKAKNKRQKLKYKYDRDIKIRNLLNKAVKNLYI